MLTLKFRSRGRYFSDFLSLTESENTIISPKILPAVYFDNQSRKREVKLAFDWPAREHQFRAKRPLFKGAPTQNKKRYFIKKLTGVLTPVEVDSDKI